MLRLYDMPESGNAYKVRLLLHHLRQPFERIEMDVVNGATRKPDFLAINPNGRVPTVVLDDGTVLAESNAILWYFAESTPFAPADRLGRAQALQWMFFEQYSHEPNIAVARYWAHHPKAVDDLDRAILPGKMKKGEDALGVMERHLTRHDFFVGGRFSIADIALYAYTHVADEGGFDLGRYGAVSAWLARVRAQTGHVPITHAESPS